jgi:hypothetical protein
VTAGSSALSAPWCRSPICPARLRWRITGRCPFILAGRDRVVAHPPLVGGPRGVSASKPLLSLAEVGDPVLAAMWREDRKPVDRLSGSDEISGHTVTVGDVDYLFLYREVAETWPRRR